MLTRTLLALAVLFLVAIATSAQEGHSLAQRAAALETSVDGLLARSQVPGFAAALADRDGLVWEKGFGTRSAERPDPVDTETVFQAASLSKVVFAYIVHQLVDQELLELDVPLAEYAPYPDLEHDERYKRVTARLALSHTSGLPNWRPRGGRLEFEHDPGERFRYSGEGFVFLQRTVEHLTGARLQEIAQDLVFEPLGMQRTSFVFEPRFEGNFATPHDGDGVAQNEQRPNQGNAAHSLLTTAGDYARFLSAILRGENLSPRRLEEFFAPEVEVQPGVPGVQWGSGVGLETYIGSSNETERALWHWGHNDGFRGYCVADLQQGEVFVYFANGDGGMLFLPNVVRIASARESSPSQQYLDYTTLDQVESVEWRIGRYLEAWEARGELSGVVLVAKGEEILFQQAYGLANHEWQTANTLDTRFHIASLTKTFTAAAIMMLAEAEELSLSDPVRRFLPDYPRGDEITLQHLLAHSAGIPDHHGLEGFASKTRDGISLEQLVTWQSTYPLEFEPGSDHRYTNSGYALLARIVEIVSGEPFDAFLEEQIFTPLRMHSTGHVSLDTPIEKRARGYLAGPPPAGVRNTEERNWDYARGSGALYSSAADLLRWSRALAAKTLFDVSTTPWPYGWGTESYGSRRSLEQTGMHTGFIATLSLLVEEDLHVVHLQNLQLGQPFQRIHRDLVRLVLERPYETPAAHPLHRPERATLATLAGTFQGERLAVTLETLGPDLYWRWPASPQTDYLRPLAPGRFLLSGDGTELHFDLTHKPTPASFTLRLPWNPDGPHPRYRRQNPDQD